MHHIIYMSRATTVPTSPELTALAFQARHINEQVGLTGMLVYSGQQFVQVLEGRHQAVKQLYARIRQDPRHTDVCTLADEPIAQRLFTNWSMAFCEPTLPEFAHLLLCCSQIQREQTIFVTNPKDISLPHCMRELLLMK